MHYEDREVGCSKERWHRDKNVPIGRVSARVYMNRSCMNFFSC